MLLKIKTARMQLLSLLRTVLNVSLLPFRDAEKSKRTKYNIYVKASLYTDMYFYLAADSDSSSSQFISPTQASGTRAQASPSAVPAGNIIGTRDHLGKRAAEALTEPIRPAALLAARSFHGAAAHARRHKNLNHLD